MNVISLVKNSLIKAGNLSLRDVECSCCKDAVQKAMQICGDLNTPEDYQNILTIRSEFAKTLTIPEGKCLTYKVTTYEIALVYERLRVLWKLGPVSLNAIKDVSWIIGEAVSRN